VNDADHYLPLLQWKVENRRMELSVEVDEK